MGSETKPSEAEMLTYGEYENEVLVAIVEAESLGGPAANSAGQVDVFEAVKEAGLELKEKWVRDAVRSFDGRGLVYNVSCPIQPPIITLMVTGEGRKEAESIRAALS